MTKARTILAALLLLLAGCTGDVPSAHLIFSQSHTLPAANPDNALLLMLNGDLYLPEDARFDGTSFILSGTYRIDGSYSGELTNFGGTISVGPSAQLSGLLNNAGGTLNIDPDAAIQADIREGDIAIPQTSLNTGSPALDGIIWFFIQAVPLILLAWFLQRFWPRSLIRIEGALAGNVTVATAIGVLFGLVALTLLVVMAFTVILMPVALLGLAALFIGIGMGLIATGDLLMGWLSRRLNRKLPAWLQITLGIILLMLLLRLMEYFWLTSMLGLILMTTGLGAVVLTRGGLYTFIPSQDAEIGQNR